ncbi:MAG TPA: hypothetical protein VK447_15020 [Myxococcaceae bacterium]|nr:hypothetical protein [Myxococcaceae bacterium]
MRPTFAGALFAGALFALALPAEARTRVSLLEPEAGLGKVRLTVPLETTGSALHDVGMRTARLERGSLLPSGLLAAAAPQEDQDEEEPRYANAGRSSNAPAIAGIVLTVSTLLGGTIGGVLLGVAGFSLGNGPIAQLFGVLGAIFGAVAGLAVGALIGGIIAAAITLADAAATPPPSAQPPVPEKSPPPAPTEPSLSLTPLAFAVDGHGVLGSGLTVRF